jgi:hypothetical protein
MANITWPAGLPATLLSEGLSMQPQDNVTRTAMDAGPKKARRRHTARTVRSPGRMVFTEAQRETFERFYRAVLADGVLRFNFTDPVTLETAEFRFAAGYNIIAVEGLFEASVQLERMS